MVQVVRCVVMPGRGYACTLWWLASTWSYFMSHNYQYKNEVGRYWRSLPRAGLESVMINDGAAALFFSLVFYARRIATRGTRDNPGYCASIDECACQEF